MANTPFRIVAEREAAVVDARETTEQDNAFPARTRSSAIWAPDWALPTTNTAPLSRSDALR
jgi:hypothetical protein